MRKITVGAQVSMVGVMQAPGGPTEDPTVKQYAVSRSGELDTSWAGSVLLRDITDVKRLKQEDGPNLVTQGSTELVHALLANDLVDAMSLFTVPVVLGGGKKLFADGTFLVNGQITVYIVRPEARDQALAALFGFGNRPARL